MSVIVDHTLLPALKQFGAFDVGACFNCGNCTAVCGLSGPPGGSALRQSPFQAPATSRIVAAGVTRQRMR